MMQRFNGVGIEAIASCVPKNIITNDWFADLLNGKEQRVFSKTVSILERRWANVETTALDLGCSAVEYLFSNHDVSNDDIGCVIFLSQTSDYKIPFSSNILQARLKLSQNVLCLDLNAGCAGFVQGLSTAYSICKTLGGKKVLLVISETLSKILSKRDRSTSMLFGDGASAILVSNDDGFGDAIFDFYSDGDNYNAIMIPHGGYRMPFSVSSLDPKLTPEGSIMNQTQLHMDGQKVFDFTLREISKSILNLLNDVRKSPESLSYFLLHQSNAFIIKQIAAQLKVDSQKFLLNISKFGNTSGVSIPLLISDFGDELKESEEVLASGYGSGLNWANVVFNLNRTKILPVREV